MRRYQQDRAEATAELLTLLVQVHLHAATSKGLSGMNCWDLYALVELSYDLCRGNTYSCDMEFPVQNPSPAPLMVPILAADLVGFSRRYLGSACAPVCRLRVLEKLLEAASCPDRLRHFSVMLFVFWDLEHMTPPKCKIAAPDQAGGSTYTVHHKDVEDGEVDALVRTLVADAISNGIVEHFRGKGAKKGFRAHYVHMWDKVGAMAPSWSVHWCQGLLLPGTSMGIRSTTQVPRSDWGSQQGNRMHTVLEEEAFLLQCDRKTPA